MIRFSKIRPLWLRAVVLLALLIPGAFGFIGWLHPDPLPYIFVWVLFGTALNLIIVNESGTRVWLASFSAACSMALLTAILGAIFDSAGNLEEVFSDGRGRIGLTYLRTLLVMLSIFPYTLFVVRSFPAGEMIQSASFAGKPMTFSRRAVILLIRVFTHVMEVMPPFKIVRAEEMPRWLVPRVERPEYSPVLALPVLIKRVYALFEATCFSLFCQTLFPIPIFVNEVAALKEINSTPDHPHGPENK